MEECVPSVQKTVTAVMVTSTVHTSTCQQLRTSAPGSVIVGVSTLVSVLETAPLVPGPSRVRNNNKKSMFYIELKVSLCLCRKLCDKET